MHGTLRQSGRRREAFFVDVAPRLSRREQDVILHELITETPLPSRERSEQLSSKDGSHRTKEVHHRQTSLRPIHTPKKGVRVLLTLSGASSFFERNFIHPSVMKGTRNVQRVMENLGSAAVADFGMPQ